MQEATKREPYPIKDITIPIVVDLSANILIPIKNNDIAYNTTIKTLSFFILTSQL